MPTYHPRAGRSRGPLNRPFSNLTTPVERKLYFSIVGHVPDDTNRDARTRIADANVTAAERGHTLTLERTGGGGTADRRARPRSRGADAGGHRVDDAGGRVGHEGPGRAGGRRRAPGGLTAPWATMTNAAEKSYERAKVVKHSCCSVEVWGGH